MSRSAAVVLGLVAIPLLFVVAAHAQINGAPASVTSPGFGGRAINGAPASVTSLGPRGYAPNAVVPFTTFSHNGLHRGDGHHRHSRDREFTGPYLYAFPVPYAVEGNAGDEDYDNADNDLEYQGGPTVFDRRGSGSGSYVPPVNHVSAPHAAQSADATAADADPPQATTILVFKDGHKLEVGNYAIVGTTLFDMTPGHARRVALADLNLEATRQQNDDRGVVFQVPLSSQGN